VKELLLSTTECAWVNDVRLAEIHAAEPLVPHPSSFEVETAIEKL
jgi:hypothetical protein